VFFQHNRKGHLSGWPFLFSGIFFEFQKHKLLHQPELLMQKAVNNSLPRLCEPVDGIGQFELFAGCSRGVFGEQACAYQFVVGLGIYGMMFTVH
jgi:hypothetical protein